jgi:hypothetical protein
MPACEDVEAKGTNHVTRLGKGEDRAVKTSADPAQRKFQVDQNRCRCPFLIHANYAACSKGLELPHRPLSNLIRFNLKHWRHWSLKTCW